ncbi:MAG: F0F1 ATP synthase subunit epsilon, partial [Lacticaseibacillus paracasei]
MAETSNVLRVNIVTPDGLVYDHHARMLVVHSVAGELGIMANHEPIVTPLEIGEVDVQRVDASDHNDSIAVNGGFMEVSENVA